MHRNDVFVEWRDGLYYVWHSALPYVQSVDVDEDDAVETLVRWYEENQPSIYYGLPVMSYWWSFHDDPYQVFIAEHKYDELYEQVFDRFQELNGDPPQQVSAWCPETILVYPLEKLRSIPVKKP